MRYRLSLQQGPSLLGPPVPRRPRRWQQRPSSQGLAGGPATPTLGSGWSLVLGRDANSDPGRQRHPHSPATGDWCQGPQRPLACPRLCPGHWVGRSWGQAGTGHSQRRNLEEEYGGPVRTTGQNSGVRGWYPGDEGDGLPGSRRRWGSFMVGGGGEVIKQRSTREHITHIRGPCGVVGSRNLKESEPMNEPMLGVP